jgi:hypothetical protein
MSTRTEQQVEGLASIGETVVGVIVRGGVELVVIQCRACELPKLADYACDSCRVKDVSKKLGLARQAIQLLHSDATQALLRTEP